MLHLTQSYNVDKKGMVQPFHEGNLHVHYNVQAETLVVSTTYGEDGYGEAVNPIEYKFAEFITRVLSNLGSIDSDDVITIEKTDANYSFVSKFLSDAHHIFNGCCVTDGTSEEEE